MVIDGFNKLTLLDYPKNTACIVFTRGCNLKCSFCQNSTLIKNNKAYGLISEDEVLSYLEKRKKILDGIVISGGEPTLQKDLIDFIKKVKTIGLKVKLDTNGTNPKVLKDLIDNNLIDYVAMDIKNDFDNYEKIIQRKIDINIIKESINILKNSSIDYEFRTTIIKEYHDINNILKILKVVGEDKYYIQNFVESDNVLDKNLHGFTDLELISLRKLIGYDKKNVKVRGIIDNNLINKEEEIYYV